MSLTIHRVRLTAEVAFSTSRSNRPRYQFQRPKLNLCRRSAVVTTRVPKSLRHHRLQGWSKRGESKFFPAIWKPSVCVHASDGFFLTLKTLLFTHQKVFY